MSLVLFIRARLKCETLIEYRIVYCMLIGKLNKSLWFLMSDSFEESSWFHLLPRDRSRDKQIFSF